MTPSDARLRDVIARRYIVTGRVQGVGFRYWTKRMADQRGIAGWVANRRDGAVVVHAEADEEGLRTLSRLLEAGPPASSVSQVAEQDAALTGLAGFSVKPTF